MTTQEIQQYIDAAVRSKFGEVTMESGELVTSAGGDGRFLGAVTATRYSGLPTGADLLLVIGQTKKQSQLIKFGTWECVRPSPTDLDLLLLKELGIEPAEE